MEKSIENDSEEYENKRIYFVECILGILYDREVHERNEAENQDSPKIPRYGAKNIRRILTEMQEMCWEKGYKEGYVRGCMENCAKEYAQGRMDAKKEMIASLVSLMKKEREVTENLSFGEIPEFLKEMKEAYDL